MDSALKWWCEHLDEYKEILKHYVAFKSVAEPEKDGLPFGRENLEMLKFMAGKMECIGMEARIMKDVFAEGKIRGKKGKHSIAVACHGDVVPAEGEWERDPFELYEKEGHLVGRGTTDNKGAAVAVLFAFRYLLESGWKPDNDFLLRIGSAEEIGMKDVEIAFNGVKMPDLTLVPDSGFPVAYGEKGSVKAEIAIPLSGGITSLSGGGNASVIDSAEAIADGQAVHAEGKGRHPATPEGGEDAVLNLMRILRSMGVKDNAIGRYLSLFPDFYGTGLGIPACDEESGRLTAVVVQVRTENNTLICTLSIRLPFSAKNEDVVAKLEKMGNVRILSSSPGYRVEPDGMIMGLNDIANRVYNSSKAPYVMAGGTYARLMQKAVAFGMGSPYGNVQPPFPSGQGRAHQRNESVEIARMEKGFLIYVDALKYLDGEFSR